MSKREIFFGGSYRMCHVAYQEERWMIVVDDDGHEYICRPGMGTWCAMSVMEMLEAMKRPDAELAAANEALTQADAALFFRSMPQVERRIKNKTPMHERQAEVDKIEAEAIARHLARQADIPSTADSA